MSGGARSLDSENLSRKGIHDPTYEDTEPTIIGEDRTDRLGRRLSVGHDAEGSDDEAHQSNTGFSMHSRGKLELCRSPLLVVERWDPSLRYTAPSGRIYVQWLKVPCRPDEPKSLYPVLDLKKLGEDSYERSRHSPKSPSSQRKQDAAKQQSSTARPSNPLENWVWYVVAIVGCLAVMGLQNFFRGEGGPSSTLSAGDRRMVTLREHLRSLRDTFGDQPEHNWQIIRSSVLDMLNETDVYLGPAVILLLASEKNERFANCLSEQVATALSFTFEDDGRYGKIAPDDFEISEDVATHVIENRCRETVEKHRQHVVLASHLEKWKPDAAMMLHPLCDQENALYKNVTYILTVFAKHEAVSGKRERKEYDKLAEDALNRAWGAMDTNQRHAIISRVTGNVVLVRDDSASCVTPS